MTAPETEAREVAIVGSGPAGLTAAIYTARARLRPVVVEGELTSNTDQPGGQLMLTTEVENYPGFVDGVMGPDLMASFRAQAERFGADIVTQRATRVDLSAAPYGIWAGDPGAACPTWTAKTVIVATGARALMLDLPNEQRLLGRGVSTCATCDGFFFRDKKIVVVGGGDSALEEATFLTRFGRSVTLIHRRKELRASKIMQDRAFKNPKIDFVWDSAVVDVLGDSTVNGVRVRHVATGEEADLETDGLFVAIGHAPNTDLFAGQLDMDAAGYLVTAAGSGCMAAIDAERYLEALEAH